MLFSVTVSFFGLGCQVCASTSVFFLRPCSSASAECDPCQGPGSGRSVCAISGRRVRNLAKYCLFLCFAVFVFLCPNGLDCCFRDCLNSQPCLSCCRFRPAFLFPLDSSAGAPSPKPEAKTSLIDPGPSLAVGSARFSPGLRLCCRLCCARDCTNERIYARVFSEYGQPPHSHVSGAHRPGHSAVSCFPAFGLPQILENNFRMSYLHFRVLLCPDAVGSGHLFFLRVPLFVWPDDLCAVQECLAVGRARQHAAAAPHQVQTGWSEGIWQ